MMRVTAEQYDPRWERLRQGGREGKVFQCGRPSGQVELVYQQYNRFMCDRLTEHFGKVRGLSCLEAGCGRGTTSMYFAAVHQVNCTLLDFSSPAMVLTKQNFASEGLTGHFVQGDVFHLPFREDSFDIVCSVGLLEHFADLDGVLSEALRVLRGGGMHISLNAPRTAPHLLDPVERLYSKLGVIGGRVTAGLRAFEWHKLRRAHVLFKKIPRDSGIPRFRSDYSPEHFRQVAERAGFQQVQVASVNPFPTFRPVPRRIDGWMASLYLGMLWVRRALGSADPFVTTHRRGRTHFLWGVKE